MLAKIERPSSMAATMEAKLSSIRIMSAAPFATSVPARPIATPMSAAFSAGASFTPSQVLADLRALGSECAIGDAEGAQRRRPEILDGARDRFAPRRRQRPRAAAESLLRAARQEDIRSPFGEHHRPALVLRVGVGGAHQ